MNKFTGLLSAGKKSVQLLVIILLSAITATSFYLYTIGVGSQIQADSKQLPIYIAKSLVPAGLSLQDALTQGLIVKQAMTASARPPDSMLQVGATNAELVAMRDLQPGQIILNSAFGFSVADAGGLPIPDGKVAVTVSLPDIARVATFIQPGSEVAAFSLLTPKGATSEPQVRLLFPKLLILALGSQVSSSQGRGTDSNLVTVAVTPLEAEKLIYGSTNTTLYFGLLTNSANVEGLIPISSANLFK